jgi:hypothetical protein
MRVPMINPFIYSLRNRAMKKALQKIFSWVIKLTYLYNPLIYSFLNYWSHNWVVLWNMSQI